MQTKYKHIHFVDSGIFASPKTWLCKNKKSGATLVQLYYYPQWRQYVASFNKNMVFSASCLIDFANFLKQLNVKTRGMGHPPHNDGEEE